MPDDPRPEGRHDDLDALLAEAFEEEPVPALSPAFEARLRRRLEAEPDAARRRLPSGARGVLAAYWIAAAAASAAAVAGFDPRALADLPWIPIALTLALTAAGLAVPLAALARSSGRADGQLAP